MKNKPLLLGITGAFGSGKTTASTYFAKKHFVRITLSSFLEEELQRRGVFPITRKALQDIGNEWRESLGGGILAQKALERIKEEQLQEVVIDGIRNLAEVEVLRTHPSFVLLAVVADRTVRFERLQKAKRREMLTWELFTQLDRRDLGIGQKDTGLQTGLCIALADVFVENNGSVVAFEKKLDAVWRSYGNQE